MFGAGPIGLGIIMALKGRGFEDIVVFDFSELRLDRAARLGVRGVYDPGISPPREILGELRGHGGIFRLDAPLRHGFRL